MGNIVTLQIEHVFRELNELDDGISKATIEGDEGFLHHEEYIEDTLLYSSNSFVVVLWILSFLFYVGFIMLFLNSCSTFFCDMNV